MTKKKNPFKQGAVSGSSLVEVDATIRQRQAKTLAEQKAVNDGRQAATVITIDAALHHYTQYLTGQLVENAVEVYAQTAENVVEIRDRPGRQPDAQQYVDLFVDTASEEGGKLIMGMTRAGAHKMAETANRRFFHEDEDTEWNSDFALLRRPLFWIGVAFLLIVLVGLLVR